MCTSLGTAVWITMWVCRPRRADLRKRATAVVHKKKVWRVCDASYPQRRGGGVPPQRVCGSCPRTDCRRLSEPAVRSPRAPGSAAPDR